MLCSCQAVCTDIFSISVVWATCHSWEGGCASFVSMHPDFGFLFCMQSLCLTGSCNIYIYTLVNDYWLLLALLVLLVASASWSSSADGWNTVRDPLHAWSLEGASPHCTGTTHSFVLLVLRDFDDPSTSSVVQVYGEFTQVFQFTIVSFWSCPLTSPWVTPTPPSLDVPHRRDAESAHHAIRPVLPAEK